MNRNDKPNEKLSEHTRTRRRTHQKHVKARRLSTELRIVTFASPSTTSKTPSPPTRTKSRTPHSNPLVLWQHTETTTAANTTTQVPLSISFEASIKGLLRHFSMTPPFCPSPPLLPLPHATSATPTPCKTRRANKTASNRNHTGPQ